MAPSVHPAALGWTYSVRRPARNRAVVTRERPDGSDETLLEAKGLARVNWTEVAQRILEDALAEPPVRKLSLDYGRFVFLRTGQTRAVSGGDIEAWLASWTLPSLPGELQQPGRH